MMKIFKITLSQMSLKIPFIFFVFILSAVLITAIRLMTSIEIQPDEAVQLEGAHRLIAGKGLTSTLSSIPGSSDVIQPPIPNNLTWWPPAFSLLVAGLLGTGLSLVWALKLLYSIITITGWIGWAMLAAPCFTKFIRIGTINLPVNYVLAVVFPLYYTPSWSGTDLFLWAGVPFVVYLFVSAEDDAGNKWKYAALSGLVFGILYSFRYASLFILIFVLLMFVKKWYLQRNKIWRTHMTFFAAACLVIVPISVYNRITKTSSGLPEYINPIYALTNLGAVFTRIADQLPSLPAIITSPLLQVLAARLKGNAVAISLLTICCCLLILLIPLAVMKMKRGWVDTESSLYFALSLIPLSLVLFLIACMFLNGYGFLGNVRYYMSAGTSIILILYYLATQQRVPNLIRLCLSTFLILTVTYESIFRPLFWLRGQRSYFQSMLLNTSPPENVPFLGNHLSLQSPNVLLSIKHLREENPTAIFYVYTPLFAYLVYDGDSRYRPIPNNKFWETAYSSKSVDIYWVIPSSCAGISSSIPCEPITSLSFLPDTKMIADFPGENTKILISHIPEGYVFTSVKQSRLFQITTVSTKQNTKQGRLSYLETTTFRGARAYIASIYFQ